jgi:hypothetical protein
LPLERFGIDSPVLLNPTLLASLKADGRAI